MYTRMQETWENTIAPDFMTLTYHHFPPGYEPPQRSARLREWDDSSPYYKNRPLRKPRGGIALSMTRKPITFRNVPKVTGVTVHSHIKEVFTDRNYLGVGGMAIQAITNVKCSTHKSKITVQNWGASKGKTVSVTAHLKNQDAYDFLSKTVELVFPRIKEWKGVKGSAGDSAGNITFGFGPEHVALYPEIEVNYDR
jgi:large subunit ribosomal protein L5